MREIKFRVWDNVDFMSSPFTLQDVQERKIQFTPECKIMQFTGLKDKDGKEIYEGDIVVRKEYPFFDGDESNYVATVEWIFNGWQQVFHCVNDKKRGISNGMNEQIEDDIEHNTDFEIIGNIHEHKHLLK